MNLKRKHSVPLIAGAFALALTGGATQAQSGATLEEIVVTAQKRAESLQDTPIAITALSARTLSDKGIQDISQIAKVTPNLVFDTTSPISGLSSGAAVFIRGIGNTDFSLTTDPGVGTYVDGMYVSRSVGGVLDVLDVERIEVLRGPQGTLFGRNTIGGALSITSRAPTEELSGSVSATVGVDGRFNFRGTLDVPFSETVRSSFAVSHKQRDGYVDRPLVGDKLGNENRQSFRGKVVYEPNDTWGFQLSADYTNIDEESAAAIGRGFTSTFPDGTPGGGGVIGFALTNAGLAGVPVTQAQVDAAVAAANLDRFVSAPLGRELRDSDYVSFGTGDTLGTTGNGNSSEIEVSGLSFVVDYHNDNFDVKYLFARHDTEGSFLSDPDNSPFSITEVNNPEYDHEQTTHELQITGSLFENRLKYIAGLYAFDEEGIDTVFVPLHTIVPGPPGTIIGFPAGLTNIAAVDNDSKAIYFQLDYDINNIWSVTAGARSTEDDKQYAFTQFVAAVPGTIIPLPFPLPGAVVRPGGPVLPGLLPLVGTGTGVVNDSFDETTIKLGLNATLDDGTLLYYSFSQGFKSGGFVLRYVSPVPEALSFDPETIDAHEIGVKWQGFNDRVRLNAALFSSEYENIQVTFYDAGGGPVTANAGTADIQGFELELTAILSDHFKLDMGYGYTDAEYTEVTAVPGLSDAIDVNDKLVNTPENTFNAGIEYSSEALGGELSIRVDYSYTDDIFNDSQNSRFLFQDSISLWNAAARYRFNENNELVLFVTNIGDERYVTRLITQTSV